MKTICWNDGLIIRAENMQDSCYLHQLVADWEHKDILEGYIDVKVGSFNPDGNLESEGYITLSEFDKLNDGSHIFYETNFEKHTGEDGKIIEIEFMGFFDFTDEGFKKILEKKIKKL